MKELEQGNKLARKKETANVTSTFFLAKSAAMSRGIGKTATKRLVNSNKFDYIA